MKVDCNRIMVQGTRLMIVKDSCLGCKINHGTCALNDLFESTGLLESWKKWNVPNFRERNHEKKDELPFN